MIPSLDKAGKDKKWFQENYLRVKIWTERQERVSVCEREKVLLLRVRFVAVVFEIV
jgi:hypothetical protein